MTLTIQNWKESQIMNSRKNILVLLLSFLIVVFFTLPVFCGPYTDDLSKCIVESTTEDDRIEFVKWMFSTIARHPATKSLASITEQQQNEFDKNAAELFMELLSDSCREKAEKAIKFEGQIAIEQSFNALGQVAARDLFQDPAVAAAVANMQSYIDGKKLKSSLNLE